MNAQSFHTAGQQTVAARSIREIVEEFCSNPEYDPREIIAAHSITLQEFNYFLNGFWPEKNGTYYTITRSIAEIEALTVEQDCDTYLEFNPTPNQTAADIDYAIIGKDLYREDTSCYSIALFKAILRENAARIDASSAFYFTKGLKLITLENRRRVIKTIVMFYITFSDNTVAYFDIADDPTHKPTIALAEKGLFKNTEEKSINVN